jgi:hypothetical protein
LDGIIALLLMAICTAYYAKGYFPGWFNAQPDSGWRHNLWKLARVGERLSPWIAMALLVMGIRHFFSGFFA